MARRRGLPRASARGAGRPLGADARARRRSAPTGACCGRRSSGTTSAPRVEAAEIEERVGLARLIELTGNRALTGFTAPKLLWLRRHEPEVYARIRHILLPKDYVRLPAHRRARDRRRRRVRNGALRRPPARVVGGGVRRARHPARVAAPVARVDRDRRRGRPGRGGARRRDRAAGTGVGRARDVGRRLRCTAGLHARPAGAAARLLPRRSEHVARDGRDAERGRIGRLAARRARRRAGRAGRGSGALGAGRRRVALRSLPRRRAHAASRSRRARRVHRALGATRPRRALARDARGRRLRPARLARAAPRARRAGRSRAASRAAARAASSGSASSRRCSACRSS